MISLGIGCFLVWFTMKLSFAIVSYYYGRVKYLIDLGFHIYKKWRNERY